MSATVMSKEEGPLKFWTAPFDPRFPNTNQTKNCWQNYVDFHRCQKKKGEDYEPCQYFKRVYTSLCPSVWVYDVLECDLHFIPEEKTEKWDEQREEGRFPGRI